MGALAKAFAVIVVLVIAAIAVVYVMHLGPFAPKKEAFFNITDVRFFEGPVAWKCKTILNETHLVRACEADRDVETVKLADGRVLNVLRGDWWWIAPAVDRVVEVMDFRRMVSYGYEVVEFPKIKANKLVKPLFNTTFELRWFRPSPTLVIGDSSLFVARGSGIEISVAVFVYDDVNRSAFPAPKDVTDYVVGLLNRFYAEPLQRLVGVPVKVVLADIGRSCSWGSANLTKLTACGLGEAVKCSGRIATVVLVKSDRMFSVLRYTTGEACLSNSIAGAVVLSATASIRVENMVNEDGIIHEVGHLLGLVDVYDVDPRVWDKVSGFLIDGSIMDMPVSYYDEKGMHLINKLTLVDALVLTKIIWKNARGVDPGLADRIYSSLLGYGLNVTGMKLLLPITPDGDLAEPFKSLAGMGIAYLKLDDLQVTMNSDLLNAMQRLAQIAQSGG